jgi:predicted MFS family arabinose efflux permease
VAGLIVVRAGYDTAFLALAALAAMALFLIWIAMPETRGSDDKVTEVRNDA